jgi:hypothetical protein
MMVVSGDALASFAGVEGVQLDADPPLWDTQAVWTVRKDGPQYALSMDGQSLDTGINPLADGCIAVGVLRYWGFHPAHVGFLNELLVFDRALSDAAHGRVVSYLRDRYG